MWFLIALALSQTLCDDIPEFDIHGAVATLKPKENGWVYFGAGFGDFGHTVNVRLWDPMTHAQIHEFYYTLDHTCPTTESNHSTSSKVFLEGATSQFAIFGVNATGIDELVVSVASTVRPIHPNSATMVIYALFLFFGACFMLTGILQFHYFRKAMDPNEYRVAG